MVIRHTYFKLNLLSIKSSFMFIPHTFYNNSLQLIDDNFLFTRKIYMITLDKNFY
ncbi:MAG: hypothetical protein BAJALOKI1v1_1560002 [Promethearchaeota archaeon]|nr:MAG: hypothetical protein BAJALOKI1v1_1560002 [Candidatus Lokiarchaeota archaeon]